MMSSGAMAPENLEKPSAEQHERLAALAASYRLRASKARNAEMADGYAKLADGYEALARGYEKLMPRE
jgi:hypothetical protein